MESHNETEYGEVEPQVDLHPFGGGDAARLNFGDCFSYALAHSLGDELLYQGANFAHTDAARAGSGSV